LLKIAAESLFYKLSEQNLSSTRLAAVITVDDQSEGLSDSILPYDSKVG